jgi:hypothetical protein
MANPRRGEVGFEAGGRRHVLRMGMNAICTLEAELGLSIVEIAEKLRTSRQMLLLRTVFRAALAEGASDDEAGELIDEVTINRAVELLGEAFQLSFPPGDDADPPSAAGAGNGSGS